MKPHLTLILTLAAALLCSCKDNKLDPDIIGNYSYEVHVTGTGFTPGSQLEFSEGEILFTKDPYSGASATFKYTDGAWKVQSQGKNAWQNSKRVQGLSVSSPARNEAGARKAYTMYGECVVNGTKVRLDFDLSLMTAKVRVGGLGAAAGVWVNGVKLGKGGVFAHQDIILQWEYVEKIVADDKGEIILNTLALGEDFTPILEIDEKSYVYRSLQAVKPGNEYVISADQFKPYSLPTTFALDSKEIILGMGQSATMGYVVFPKSSYLNDVPMTAEVSSNGVVTLSEDNCREITVAAPGTVTITYKLCDGSKLEAKLVVKTSAYRITFSEKGPDGFNHSYDVPAVGLIRYPGFKSTLWLVDGYGGEEVNDVQWKSSSSAVTINNSGNLSLGATVQTRQIGREYCMWYGESTVTACDPMGNPVAMLTVIANACGMEFCDEDGKILGSLPCDPDHKEGTFTSPKSVCYASILYYDGEKYGDIPAENYSLSSSDANVKFSPSDTGKADFDATHVRVDISSGADAQISCLMAGSGQSAIVGTIKR